MLICEADSDCCSPEEDGLRKEKLETNGTEVENRGLLHSQLQSKEKPVPVEGVVSTRKEENDDLHVNAEDWSCWFSQGIGLSRPKLKSRVLQMTEVDKVKPTKSFCPKPNSLLLLFGL